MREIEVQFNYIRHSDGNVYIRVDDLVSACLQLGYGQYLDPHLLARELVAGKQMLYDKYKDSTAPPPPQDAAKHFVVETNELHDGYLNSCPICNPPPQDSPSPLYPYPKPETDQKIQNESCRHPHIYRIMDGGITWICHDCGTIEEFSKFMEQRKAAKVAAES